MASKNIFYQNPLLKLAIPLMAGIVIGWVCDISLLHILTVFIPSLLMLSIGMIRFAPKWLFGVGAMVFMLSVGLFVENEQAQRKAPQWGGKKDFYTASLVEMPTVRGTNVKVLAELISKNDSLVGRERTQGLVYLYFPRTVASEELSAGDVLTFEAKVTPPENRGNPAEFDIERYYYVKGVTGTAYVPDRKWRILPQEKKNLQIYALELRSKVIVLYERLGFEGESLALLSALTLGEKRDFPQELKESFSVAGASHILALSGLHLGILYMLLAFVIPLRNASRVYRFFSELAIILVLWGFAFVAGLSPSVVRSAMLFTLMSSGRLLGYDVSPVSSLSFAAIVMLLFSPHLLFDVSFQLSFSAVLAILLLAPPLRGFLGVYKHGAVYGYVVNLLILSVVAQVGVLPFIWYYFGVFPLYFLLTNLFVVPLAFVVIMLVVILWLLIPIPLLQHGVAWLLGLVVDLMNAGVENVALLPGASFALPPLTVWGAVCVAIFVVLFLVALFKRRTWLAVSVSCIAVFVMLVYFLFVRTADEGNYMIIYNNRKNPLVHLVYEGGDNYLVSTVPQLDAEYEYVSKPFQQQKALPIPQWVSYGYNDSVVQYNDGLFVFDDIKVKMLDNPHWAENVNAEPVDILVLCRGFLGRINKLVKIYPASCVVVDASLYKHSRERIIREYSQLGIEVVDIADTGAMKVVVQDGNFDLIPMRDK